MLKLNTFESIFDLLNTFPNEQACLTYLENERWKGNVISPFDSTSTVYKCKNNRYKCRNTNKYFNAKTDTIFDSTKISLQKWFMAIYIFTSHKKGISSCQLAKDIKITQKAAWFVLQRLRHAMQTDDFLNYMQDEINSVVEVDETFVGGKNKNRHAHKKVANSQGRSFKDKTPVFGILSRNDEKVKCVVVPNTKKSTIRPIILENVKEGITIHSDEWKAYKGLRKMYNHKVVNHGNSEFVNGDCYTNTIEGFWSLFKRGIFGIYHHASRKHMQKYADEFSFRYNHRKNTTSENFNLFLQATNGRRLKYHHLINQNAS